MGNDQVTIDEATIKVGAKTPEHSRLANKVTSVLSGGKGKVTLPDGTTKISEYKTGKVTRRTTAETYVTENVGDTEIRLLTHSPEESPRVATGPGNHNDCLPRPFGGNRTGGEHK